MTRKYVLPVGVNKLGEELYKIEAEKNPQVLHDVAKPPFRIMKTAQGFRIQGSFQDGRHGGEDMQYLWVNLAVVDEEENFLGYEVKGAIS